MPTTRERMATQLQRLHTYERASTVGVAISVTAGHILVRCPRTYNDRLRAAGARWDREMSAWTLAQSPIAAVNLALAFQDVASQVEVGPEFMELLRDARAVQQAGELRGREDLPDHPSRTASWTHQRQAYEFLARLRAGGLFMGMGTGKSKVAVDLVINRVHRRTLIVCPKSVVGVWPREFERHGAEPVDVVRLEGPLRGRCTTIQEGLRRQHDDPQSRPLVFVTNYESIWQEPLQDCLLGVRWDCVILDEAHRIKSPGARVSQTAQRLGRRAEHRIALTGTPMPHSPLDVYAVYRFLDPGVFGTNFAAFRERYATLGGYEGREVLGYRNADELADRMYTIAYRVSEDVLDLPETTDEDVRVTLSPRARRAYRQMEEDMLTRIGDGTISAQNVLVQLLRLQQITSGFLPGENGEGTQQIDTAKRDALRDLAEDTDATEPIVVFTRFVHDLDAVRQVAEQTGRRYGELSGRQRDLLPDATMPGDVQLFGVQIQSGGVGIDLTRSRLCVFYSLGFSLGDYLQARRRVHRPGQHHPVTYYHYIAEDTIDARVYEVLSTRHDLVEGVIGQYRRLVGG